MSRLRPCEARSAELRVADRVGGGALRFPKRPHPLTFCPAGVLGIKVKIMLPWDPSGKIGPKKPLPDHVSIVEPKEDILPTTPISEQKGAKPEQPPMPQPVPTA